MKLRHGRQYQEHEIDYQCGVCHVIYRGPHQGANPGKQVAPDYQGSPVSHGYCSEHDNEFMRQYREIQRRRKGGH